MSEPYHSHCWHTKQNTRICCHCGKKQDYQTSFAIPKGHGKYYPPEISGEWVDV